MKISKRIIPLLLLAALLLSGCGKEEELGAWEMPAVDTKPTVAPTAPPSYGGGSPESYVWNEAALFNMAEPGVSEDSVQLTYSHKQCAELFPYNFMPASLFSESYSAYNKLSLKKTNHDVMLHPTQLSLADNAYVEYVFAPSTGRESMSLFVMAELLDYADCKDVYDSRLYPHLSFAEGTRVQLSKYYLKDFVLAKCGEQRIAQVLKLYPSSYFTDSEAAMAKAADEGGEFLPQRQILLTISCGIDMTDEQFIAAVTTLLNYSDGSEKPVVDDGLPKPGEKGAA